VKSSEQVISAADKFHMNTYARFPVVFVKAEGTKVWDANGKEYTDFLSGIGTLNLGHCPKKVVDAFCRQARELGHVSNLFYTGPQAAAAARLGELGGGKVFFANSGAEANEGALKLARRWGKINFSEQKTNYVTALKSFHGRTLTTLAATGQPEKGRFFEPLPSGFKHVPFNDIDALSAAVDDKTCAVMLEVVQGEGGVWPASLDYLRAVRKLCDDRRTLLIFDEVQTGMGRTGKFFAYEHFDIRPDIVTLAKSLAGGFPVGALIARDEIAQAFVPGDHATTFGGGPATCAAILAVLEVLKDDQLIERAATVGEYLRTRLETLAEKNGLIEDVRGLGLMVGLTLKAGSARRIVIEMLEKGFIINSVGDNTLRFLPPLIISIAEIDAMLAALRETLET
jgi:acetylornithine/N-succinyldiaminopimelate aminotransferase